MTLRDRTELQAVTGELDVVRGLTESLRAQNHEAANRLHTVVSLIEMGRSERAVEFATEELRVAQELADQVVGAVQEPVLAALLLGKTAEAAERGIDLAVDGDVVAGELTVQPRSWSPSWATCVDNAMDAVAEPRERRIVVHVEGDAEGADRRGGGQRRPGSGPRTRAGCSSAAGRPRPAAVAGSGWPWSARSRASTAARSRSTPPTSVARGSPSPLPGAPPVSPVSADVRVLVVEDEELAAEAHAEYVRRVDGFELAGVARSAAEALRHLAQRPAVDLVLLDMHLPDGHGLALLQRLRAAGHLVRRDRRDLGARHRRRAPRRHPGGRALPAQAVLVRDVPLQARALRGVPAPARGHRRRRRAGRGGPGLRRRCAAARGPRELPKGLGPETLRQVTDVLRDARPRGGPVGDRGRRGRGRLAGHRAPLPRAPRRPGPGRRARRATAAAVARRSPTAGAAEPAQPRTRPG